MAAFSSSPTTWEAKCQGFDKFYPNLCVHLLITHEDDNNSKKGRKKEKFHPNVFKLLQLRISSPTMRKILRDHRKYHFPFFRKLFNTIIVPPSRKENGAATAISRLF
ncbi:hypothetical protein CEXT_64671 [Caerostris extrusa]|uniref:Uncharacterized protein n=1 Tax=Caerostris extrusa TaxID=172846 RepID=A0AAV4UVX7_CAEEX|nr:hypothetical protein CEXT_64671 [Caerostris extrusa]